MSKARLYVPATDVTGPHSALYERDSGPVTEVYLAEKGPFLELREMADFDTLISVLVTAKAEHGLALGRFAASRPEPLPAREPRFIPVVPDGMPDALDHLARAHAAGQPVRTTGPLSGDDLPAEDGHPYPPAPGTDGLCPRCGSHLPALHPAMQEGGEVQPCPDPFHGPPHPLAGPSAPLEPVPDGDGEPDATARFLAVTEDEADAADRAFAQAWGTPDSKESAL